MFNNSTIFIGIDTGDKLSAVVILDQDEEVIEESRIHTRKNAFSQKFSNILSDRSSAIGIKGVF